MSLKKPTECCGTSTLLWSKEKQHFACPCGKFKVSESGQPLGKRHWAWRKRMNQIPKL